MRLIYLLLLITFSACSIEEITPRYDMVCEVEKPDWITFNDVQDQYNSSYQATTVFDNKVIKHEVISVSEKGVITNESFELVVDKSSKCVYLKSHTRSTSYTHNAKSLTEKTIYPIEQFYFTRFTSDETEDKENHLLIGENEGRLFYILF